MAKKIKDKKNNETVITYSKIDWLEIFKILPLLFIVGILPFVIRLKLIPLEGPFYEFWSGEQINADFFTYYKQIFIYLVTAWALLHTFFFTKKIKFTKAYYFMGAYAILVILSTVFSKYPQIALHGFVERREGMWVILCYLLLMFSTINLVETEKHIKAIIYTLGISGAVISLIALFQYFGFDIFLTDFIKQLIIPLNLNESIKEFNIGFGKGQSYSVFYNPNYLGGYLCLYIPIVLVTAIYSIKKSEKIMFAGCSIIGIIAMIFSKSDAGILGMLISSTLGIGCIIIEKHFYDNGRNIENSIIKKIFIITTVLCMILYLISYIPFQENFIKNLRTQVETLILPSKLPKIEGRGPINDIKIINDNQIDLTIDTKLISLTSNNGKILIKDRDKETIFDNKTNQINIIKISPKNFGKFELKISQALNQEDTSGIELFYTENEHHIKLYFLVNGDKIFLTNPKFKEIKSLDEAITIGFEGKYNIGSGRGYIWSRSIPLAFQNVLIGTGQDTFITVFPQDDIFGNQKSGRYHSELMWQIVDKPHNMFLQVAIQSGLMSLLIILFGLLFLLFKSLKIFFLERDSNLIKFNISILGFILSSFFNDSIITIMPIVYIFLAICLNLSNNKGEI